MRVNKASMPGHMCMMNTRRKSQRLRARSSWKLMVSLVSLGAYNGANYLIS